MLCQECPKKPGCKELCPEAVAYVNQDYVPSQEHNLSSDYIDRNFSNEDLRVRDFQKGHLHPGALKNLIYLLARQGKSASEIAYHLPCSHSYIARISKKMGHKKSAP